MNTHQPKADPRTGQVLIPTTWNLLAAQILTTSGNPTAEALARQVLNASEATAGGIS
jgi:hypothetical protein